MVSSQFFNYPDTQVNKSAAFLAGLRDDEVKAVLGYMQTLRFRKGEMALRYGDNDNSFYIVVTGQLEVLVASRRGPRRVSLMDPGDMFGELAFFDDQPRSADIRALEDSELTVMTSSGFDRLRVARPQLALAIVQDMGRVLSLRFRDLNRRLIALDKL
ncbi:MAG: cyclic nucleotide-binding domain-containing protein [Dehalococcoidia bacterium]|nr:cyclic nucleotide-binding domain-containing protein [Dehalococcoidia bacterium]